MPPGQEDYEIAPAGNKNGNGLLFSMRGVLRAPLMPQGGHSPHACPAIPARSMRTCQSRWDKGAGRVGYWMSPSGAQPLDFFFAGTRVAFSNAPSATGRRPVGASATSARSACFLRHFAPSEPPAYETPYSGAAPPVSLGGPLVVNADIDGFCTGRCRSPLRPCANLGLDRSSSCFLLGPPWLTDFGARVSHSRCPGATASPRGCT